MSAWRRLELRVDRPGLPAGSVVWGRPPELGPGATSTVAWVAPRRGGVEEFREPEVRELITVDVDGPDPRNGTPHAVVEYPGSWWLFTHKVRCAKVKAWRRDPEARTARIRVARWEATVRAMVEELGQVVLQGDLWNGALWGSFPYRGRGGALEGVALRCLMVPRGGGRRLDPDTGAWVVEDRDRAVFLQATFIRSKGGGGRVDAGLAAKILRLPDWSVVEFVDLAVFTARSPFGQRLGDWDHPR